MFQFRYYALRLSEKYYELRFGIQSDGCIPPRQLGLKNLDSHEYTPVPYRSLWRIFDHLKIAASEREVFLDIGCGMGRPLVVAARYPFQRIIGVELSPELATIARRNLERLKRRACPAHVVQADACNFEIPDDASVILFANPFRGETLRTVIRNIARSLLRKPRVVRIVYYNRVYFDAETKKQTWIRKVFAKACYPHGSWALYEADGFALKASGAES